MIGHLVIVAGVSGSGKTTLVQRMQAGEGPLDLRRCPAITIRTLGSSKQSKVDCLILDYDLNDLSEEPLKLADEASEITVINLRPPLATIIRQLTQREKALDAAVTRKQIWLYWRVIKRLLDGLSLFAPSVAKRLRRFTPFRVRNRMNRMEAKLAVYSESYLASLYSRWDDRVSKMPNVVSTIQLGGPLLAHL